MIYCKKLNLVIEIDGESHIDNEQKDIVRQKKLETIGLSFLRFNDIEVKCDLFNVLKKIEQFIDEFENAEIGEGESP